MDNNELQHWGIKGMKWGVRRYQNKDGTLTAAGKKRYKDNADSTELTAPKKKSVSEMTDDELARAINRARMEDQYRMLRPETIPAGRKFASKILNEAIVPASVNAGRRFLENSLNKFGDTILKDKAIVDPDSVSELEKTAKKLELKNKIDKLSKGESDMSWDDRLKQQTYEKNLADKILDDLVRANKITEAKSKQAELQKMGQDIVEELLDELKDK